MKLLNTLVHSAIARLIGSITDFIIFSGGGLVKKDTRIPVTLAVRKLQATGIKPGEEIQSLKKTIRTIFPVTIDAIAAEAVNFFQCNPKIQIGVNVTNPENES